MRQDFRLESVATSLDPVLVAANWSGVRGVVGDIRFLRHHRVSFCRTALGGQLELGA